MLLLKNYRIYSFHSFGSSFDPGQPPVLGNLVDGFQEPISCEAESFDRDHMRRPPVFVPDRVIKGIALRYRSDPVFTKNDKERGRDFYMPLKRLVNGRDTERCQIYGLSERAKRLLKYCDLYSGQDDGEIADRCKHKLVLLLSEAAYKRIRASLNESGISFPVEFLTTPTAAGMKPIAFIPLRVHDVLVYQFSTGRVICQLEMEPDLPDNFPATVSVFAEIIDIVSRFPNLAWLEVSSGQEKHLASGEKFTIGSMVARLLGGANGVYEVTHRTFTHCFAMASSYGEKTGKAALQQMAARFARQYTADYALSEDADGVHIVSDFDNVIHAVAREGAATIVDPGNGNIAFLNEYRTASLDQSYLPLVAANLHYHAKALDLLAHAVFSTSDHTEVLLRDEPSTGIDLAYREMMTDWRTLEDNVALLNSRFRFRQVSQVTMQNAFNRALRKAFDLDELEVQLRDDMSQMSGRMQEAIQLRDQSVQRKFEKRYFWLPVLAAAFAAASLASQLIQTWNSIPANGGTSVFWIQMAAFLVPVAIGILWSVYWRRKRPLQ